MSVAKRRNKRGFTLIELLVVIAIIAILAAILFPVFVKAKEAGRATKCAANMKQINVALLSYLEDFGGRFPNSRGMYYCRLLDIVHGVHTATSAVGPYALDLLMPYVKSRDVWLCPSLSATQIVQPYSGWADQGQYTWLYNCGGNVLNRKTASNYMWIHARITHHDYAKHVMVSGSPASEVKRPVRAMMFMEMPYWEGADVPHKTDQYGINVVFYDGHVKMERNPIHAFLNLSWQGWEY